MPKLTRRRLLCATAPLAAAPLGLAIARSGDAGAAAHDHSSHRSPASHNRSASMGHAAMIGEGAPAVGGPNDLDALLYPPRALPYQPGRVRPYTLRRDDKELEIAPGVFFPAWTYNGTVPGPGDPGDGGRHPARAASSTPARTRTRSTSTGSTRRTWTASSRSSSRGDEFTYEFPARPAGFHLYHCHATPLKKHIHKGLYGAFIIDPKKPRAPAQELVIVMNGYDTDADGGNNFYTVNGRTFYYARYPIRVKRAQLVRHLPREPDRVRPDQLVPPARRLLPLPADRHG